MQVEVAFDCIERENLTYNEQRASDIPMLLFAIVSQVNCYFR